MNQLFHICSCSLLLFLFGCAPSGVRDEIDHFEAAKKENSTNDEQSGFRGMVQLCENARLDEKMIKQALSGKEQQIRKFAEQENSHAQFLLGLMYEAGVGVAKDDASAANWYRKSTLQGNSNGQLSLGMM